MKSAATERKRTIHRKFFGSWIADWELTRKKIVARLGAQAVGDVAAETLEKIIVTFSSDQQIYMEVNGKSAPYSSIQILSTTLNSIYVSLVSGNPSSPDMRALFIYQGDDVISQIVIFTNPDGEECIHPAIYFRRLSAAASV